MSSEPIVIINSSRTPLGNFLGALSSLSATQLGTASIKATIQNLPLKASDIDEVIMGCVLPAGLGQAPARQAALNAKLSNTCRTTTINKMCGSGMQSVMFASNALKAYPNNLLIAGGMESMSNAPHLLTNTRKGLRFGHKEIYDHMLLDGLEDSYDKGKHMGCFADETAKEYKITREMQDDFALHSLEKALIATKNGIFKKEITPINTTHKKETKIIDIDEGPQKANKEKIPLLKPAFQADGTVTAANASSISDGAASLLLSSKSFANKNNLPIKATICAYTSVALEPKHFTVAPIQAIKKLLEIVGWSQDSVDLYEINEAFAVVTLVAMQSLNLPPEKVNIHGGACVLGHPLGATGARIIVTLLNALKHNNLKRGIAALCIGGGEATAIAVELP